MEDQPVPGTPAAPDEPSVPSSRPQQEAADGLVPLDPLEQAPVRAHRSSQGAWLGGVAAGIADHLGWPVMLVRGAFVLLG
ncbi:MAG: PspC domain-containing protein, partial [Luteococcus japonicus]